MLFQMFQKKSHLGMPRIIHRLFYTRLGQILISALFGVALAFLFQSACKGDQCIVYKSPDVKGILGETFDIGNGKCFEYNTVIVPCDEKHDA